MIARAVCVRAFPRLHFGLINVSNGGDRVYGGSGVLLDTMATLVSISSGSSNLVCAEELRPLVVGVQRRLNLLSTETQIRIDAGVPMHSGLGLTTGALLATTLALSEFFDLRLTREEIVAVTGRGGASGVGVNAFFEGGVLADKGHQRNASTKFVPSEFAIGFNQSPIAWRHEFPADWRIVLFGDTTERPLTPEDEKELFQRWLPLDSGECDHVAKLVFSDLCSAFETAQLCRVAAIFSEIRQYGLKRLEINRLSPRYQNAFARLDDFGVAASLSSFGPTAFAIVKSENENGVVEIISSCGLSVRGVARGRNGAHIIERL